MHTTFEIEDQQRARILRLRSEDGMNRLSRATVLNLLDAVRQLSDDNRPLIITGNEHFFSAGADLNEIASLTGHSAYEFAKTGQELMQVVAELPAPVYAAISGYCMGGGLDLALACHSRIGSPHAVVGHRGAALGLITGWGGTQRLPRLVGKARALEMFVAAEKIRSDQALRIGLIDGIADDPVAEALRQGSNQRG